MGRAFAGFVLMLALAGCGGSPPSPAPSPSPTASPTFASTPELNATPAPSPTPRPTFVATGEMNDLRMYATATLLLDGRVLIAGGSSKRPFLPWMGSTVLASAELYDPATGKFTPTGSMRTARSDATATLLPDGRVLIAGGYGCVTRSCRPDTEHDQGPLASAELYDPATGKFTPTGSMSVTRTDAASLLLRDGRVLLLLGGSSLVELYDPATGKFTRKGSLRNHYIEIIGGAIPDTGSFSSAVLMPDDRVLVIGPTDGEPAAELFDPTTGKSTPITLVVPPGAVEAARAAGDDAGPDTAILLKDGRVLLCLIDYLVTYDPAAGTFTQSGSISGPAQWWGSSSTLLADGRVLFAGGELRQPAGSTFPGSDSASLFQAVNSAGVYDPAGGYRAIVSMPEARDGHTATLLPDGTVLILGGTSDEENGLSSADLFRP